MYDYGSLRALKMILNVNFDGSADNLYHTVILHVISRSSVSPKNERLGSKLRRLPKQGESSGH
jgi:hypothetical protein